MNTKRIVFWSCFVVVLGLIVWGLAVALNKPATSATSGISAPAPVSATDHTIGTSTAPVTLIEYGDFQCPACEAYYPIVEQLLTEASSTVYYVFRNFPLPQHPNAIPAAIAAEAAGKQGKYWDMFNMIYPNHADWTELADPSSVFAGYAAKIGLDMAKYAADLKDPAVAAKVQSDLAEGQNIGVDYTPSFFINGKIITNPQSYADFKALIQTAASGSSK